MDEQECKISALDSLLEIFKNDSYKKAESNQLLKLAIDLLALMDRETIQAVDLDAQNKIAEVYSTVMETLLIHYGKHHINAITKELKIQLRSAATSLKKLNRNEDIKLKYFVNCALEGIRRLKDDRLELFELLERTYKIAIAAISFYLKEPEKGFTSLEQAFKDLDPHLPNTWSNAVMLLKRLTKDVKDDLNQLTPVLLLIGKKHKDLNWKFSYASIEMLFNLAMNGKTKEIRHRALIGAKSVGPDFPGLAYFANSKNLKSYKSLKPMLHFQHSEIVDPNIRIRKASIERLIFLVEKSDDQAVVHEAYMILAKCAKNEKNLEILEILEKYAPKKDDTSSHDKTNHDGSIGHQDS
jgi:hypothetical protein